MKFENVKILDFQFSYFTHTHTHTHYMGSLPGDISEDPVTQEKRKTGWRMSCDIGEAMEGLENKL